MPATLPCYNHSRQQWTIFCLSKTMDQYYYFPFLEKWLSVFIHECLERQRDKHLIMKTITAPLQLFSEHAPSFNYRVSMDTKGSITPSSQIKSHIHVIVDAFSHFVVSVPVMPNNAKTAVKTLLHHWNVKFGHPIYLVTDRGSKYINTGMEHLCTLMGIHHSPRTPYSFWTNGPTLKLKIKSLVHKVVVSYKTLPRIGHTKFICMLRT